jgi:tetratricopeptide (TPR) repeat protein
MQRTLRMFTRQKILFSLFSLWLPAVGMAKPKEGSPEANQTSQAQQGLNLEKAKELFAQGEDFFKFSQFGKAIEKYQEAYLLSKAPLLLLNLGQCYYHLSQPEEAKHSYEAFIREDPTNPYRAEAEEKIKEMQGLIDARRMASLPLAMQRPGEEPSKRKPWLWVGASGVLLGGAALTFVLFSNKNSNPTTELGGQFVDF